MEKPGYVLMSAHHHNVIIPKLYHYYLNKRFVDVKLLCNGGQLQAHSVVLASNSKYFDLTLSTLKKNEDEISVPVSVDVMARLVQFMYLGNTMFEALEVDGVRAAARLLQIFGLEDILFEPVTDQDVLISDEADLEKLLVDFEAENCLMEEPPAEEIVMNPAPKQQQRRPYVKSGKRKKFGDDNYFPPGHGGYLEDAAAVNLILQEMERDKSAFATPEALPTRDCNGDYNIAEDTGLPILQNLGELSSDRAVEEDTELGSETDTADEA